MTFNQLDKRRYSVNLDGPQENTVLLDPQEAFGDDDFSHVKLHVRDVHLKMDASATVILKIGDQTIFERAGVDAHEHHVQGVDLFAF